MFNKLIASIGFLTLILLIYIAVNRQNNLPLKDVLTALNLKSLCKDCNVIMVSLDTLSGNHLPCYGYYRNTAPNLCTFADNNVMFNNAYSNATWTLPSHVSIFTGLYPFKHGVNKYFDTLGSEKILLPELLKSNGYNTLFFIPFGDPTLPVDGVYSRVGQGLYDNEVVGWKESIDMFKKSVRNNKKTFMFLHTYDVHAPYDLQGHEPIYPLDNKNIPKSKIDVYYNFSNGFIDYFAAEVERGIDRQLSLVSNREIISKLLAEFIDSYPDYAKSATVLQKIWGLDGGTFLYDFTFYYNYKLKFNINNPSDVDTLRSLYDQTINIVDTDKIPLVTNLIKAPEFKDNTILIIFSDHGEEFMEHGHISHETLYNSNIRVPLIMHIPGLNNVSIKQQVQLVDLFPTLLEILGIKNSYRVDGKSLVGRILGFDNSTELIVSDMDGMINKSLLYGPWKLFLAKQVDGSYIPYELYNIDKDPGETNNILFSNSPIRDKLLRMYPYPLNY